jgi:hypothetical protein
MVQPKDLISQKHKNFLLYSVLGYPELVNFLVPELNLWI